MKYPQLLIYESDGAIAELLGKLAADQGWLIRQCRSAETIFELLKESRISVVFLKFERDLLSGLELLSQITSLYPDCSVVVVSDVKADSQQRENLACLVFDLGAKYIVFPPLTQPVAEDLANGCMISSLRMAGL